MSRRALTTGPVRRLNVPTGASRFSTTTSHSPGSNTPPAEVPLNDASTRVQAIHPFGLPLTRHRPDGTSNASAFPPSLAPRRRGAGQRTSGAGTGYRARTTLATSAEPPIQRYRSNRATSRRTDQRSTRRHCAVRAPVSLRPLQRPISRGRVKTPDECDHGIRAGSEAGRVLGAARATSAAMLALTIVRSRSRLLRPVRLALAFAS